MARMVDHGLRTSGVDSASVDATHAAGLPEHVLEARHGCHARRSRGGDPPSITNAGDHKIHRRQWPRICRSSLSLCMYHDRVWGSFRFSFSHCLGHYAIVIHTKGKTGPANTRPLPSMNFVIAGICNGGWITTTAAASMATVPSFKNVLR